MMHINMNVFPVPTPLVMKMCKGFDGCFFFIKRMSLTSVQCSLLSFHISVENDSYGKSSSTLLESIYVVNLFFKYLSFDFVLFSYFKPHGSIFKILVSDEFFFGLFALVILFFEKNCPIHLFHVFFVCF